MNRGPGAYSTNPDMSDVGPMTLFAASIALYPLFGTTIVSTPFLRGPTFLQPFLSS